ncbi:MAG: hypothetical protein JJ902_09850 [Roseibium sp.]|nr:hypothetical protein [Roseibium sp.]
MALIRNIDTSRAKRVFIRDRIQMLEILGFRPVCEGIETPAEDACFRDPGVDLMHGCLSGRPEFEAPPKPNWLGRHDVNLAAASQSGLSQSPCCACSCRRIGRRIWRPETAGHVRSRAI